MRQFYVHLRETHIRENGCNPITMRQLESLIRLTQARAKCEMRKTCTENDALEVIEIMKASMVDYYSDENGELDTTRSFNTKITTNNKINSIKALSDHLLEIAEERENKEFTIDELKNIIQVSIFYLNEN